MLKSIRKNTKFIIWTVVLSFVLWGGFSVGVQFQKQGRIAGEIFGKGVSFQEYNQFYKSQQLFSFGGTEASKEPEMLQKQTWESLIFSREAKRLKIDVSDDEVRNEIYRLMAELKIEKPTAAVYKRWLDATVKETPQEFESQIRELLRIQKLVKKIQSENTSTPATEEEARLKFEREQNQFAAEFVSFKSLAEAQAFISKVKKAEDWKKETAALKMSPQTTGLMSVASWMELWGLPEKDAEAFIKSEKGAIHGPVNQNDSFVVLKISEKKPALEEEFQKTYKDKYIEEINNRRSYEHFLEWHKELVTRAKPKDYLPSTPSSEIPAAEPPAAQTVPAQ